MKNVFPTLISFGYCSKTFGYKGEVKILLNFKYKENTTPKFVWCHQYGKPVPYFVEDFILLNDNECSVKLEDISNENDALPFRNKEFYIEKELLETYFVAPKLNKDILDFSVKHKGKLIGRLKEIQENKIGHPIMLIDNQKDEILIPFVEEFIVDIDENSKIINVNLPEGLLDLYL